MAMTTSQQAKTVIPRLHEAGVQALPFGRSLDIRSFVLERREGNLLVYSTSDLDPGAPPVSDLGGIARHYLNHRHEAMFAPRQAIAPVFTHQAERESVEETMPVRATFSRRHLLDDDFEVIPTPGHTAGATAFLWDTGQHRLLFTGDSIYLDGGEWVGALLDSSDRQAYVESLELLRETEFDVLVPWAATAGEPHWSVASRADARRRIGAIINRFA